MYWATNYDPNVTHDLEGVAGECVRSGCTDSNASNFDPYATNDDGSCIVVGCGWSGAVNDVVTSNSDIPTDYLTDAADNYNQYVTADGHDLSLCEFTGCTDSTAFNYHAGYTAGTAEDCEAVVEGCMLYYMTNYDSTANTPGVGADACCINLLPNAEADLVEIILIQILLVQIAHLH